MEINFTPVDDPLEMVAGAFASFHHVLGYCIQQDQMGVKVPPDIFDFIQGRYRDLLDNIYLLMGIDTPTRKPFEGDANMPEWIIKNFGPHFIIETDEQ